MDTTFFWKRGKDQFGVTVFRSPSLKRNLLWKVVDKENMETYRNGVLELESTGWIIEAIVCDGRKGFFSAFSPCYLVQMCQFHQVQIVTRYLTRHPKTEAGKALRKLILLLTKTDKESFVYWIDEWYQTYQSFLGEQTINPETNRKQFTHKRLRSAYRSIMNNMPYLWTWYDYIHDISIPNTTNCLDGTFSHINSKVNVHRWATKEKRLKILSSLLSR